MPRIGASSSRSVGPSGIRTSERGRPQRLVGDARRGRTAVVSQALDRLLLRVVRSAPIGARWPAGVGSPRATVTMEIRLLGLVEASHEGHAVPLGGAKPRALLAMLALHANAPVSA